MWRSLKKLKIELPYDPAIALLGIYTKDTDVVRRKGMGRLGGTAVKRLPLAQGMILALWDRAPHQAPLL